MNSVKNKDIFMEDMTVNSNDTKGSYVFETYDLFVIAGFVADDGHSFETILKLDEVNYDEENLSSEERSKVLQQKELIDELLDDRTQSVEDDKKIKGEKEMYKDISTRKNKDCIMMEWESPWIVMKCE